MLNFASSSCVSPDDSAIAHLAASQSNGITCCALALPCDREGLAHETKVVDGVQVVTFAAEHSDREASRKFGVGEK